MGELLPIQIEGAAFLAQRRAAALFDEPGVGKTAQAIVACDMVGAKSVLVVTTASARANWLNEFDMWSLWGRSAAAVYTTDETVPNTEIVSVAWSNFNAPAILPQLLSREWDALIIDEAHYAAHMTSDTTIVARTRAMLGQSGLISKARRVWPLTGTPIPNTPIDIWPLVRALAPHLLFENPDKGWPRVVDLDDFAKRYTITKKVWANGRNRTKFIDGQNEAELSERLKPFYMRRKCEGLPPIRYSVYALHADKLAAENVDQQAILDAAEAEDTQALDMHLGPLRRELGVMKARAVVDVVAEGLQNGVDKIVLFFWHTDAGRILRDGLKQFGVVGIDGSTPADKRQQAVEDFQRGSARVFVGQIQAAGEAITLTAANQLIFVEISFTPKDMAQAVRRILRRGQTRPCTCRIAALEGSIDEALMRIVRRKVETIRAILED